MYGDFKQEIEAKSTGKTAVTYVIMNGIEPHAKRTNQKRKKQYHPETTIRIECLDTIIIMECLDIFTMYKLV